MTASPTPQPYAPGPSRDEIDAMQEPVVVDFGTNWCGVCNAARPAIEAALARHPDIAHVKIEDGKGRPAGRSFGVQLWPTLVFLRGGREVARLVRPRNQRDVERALEALAAG